MGKTRQGFFYIQNKYIFSLYFIYIDIPLENVYISIVVIITSRIYDFKILNDSSNDEG